MTDLSPGQFVALFGGGPVGDPSLTLNQNYLLDSGSTMAMAAAKGPILTFTRASGDASHWDENALLVYAATNEPRFDHHPVTSEARGLLPEGQGENISLQSEDLATVWGSSGGMSVTTNDRVAPDGNITADKLDNTGGVSTDNVNQTINTGATIASKDFKVSLFVYFASTGTKTIRMRGTGATQEAESLPFSVTEVNVWRRYDVMKSFTGAADGNNIFVALYPGEFGVGTGVGWFWGIDTKQASFVTSYIPTTTAAVTRSADVCSATITSLLGSANTLVISARTGYGAGVVVQLDDGTENERYRVERNASNELRLFVTDGGVEQVGASGLNLGTVADLTDFTLAIRLAANDFASSLDGAAVVTDTSGTLPTVTTIRVGMDTSNDEWNSTIAEIKLFNVGKPDSFLRSIAA